MWRFKQLYLGNQSESDTCSYELLFSQWPIPPPPKILTFPAGSSCIYSKPSFRSECEQFPAPIRHGAHKMCCVILSRTNNLVHIWFFVTLIIPPPEWLHFVTSLLIPRGEQPECQNACFAVTCGRTLRGEWLTDMSLAKQLGGAKLGLRAENKVSNQTVRISCKSRRQIFPDNHFGWLLNPNKMYLVLVFAYTGRSRCNYQLKARPVV